MAANVNPFQTAQEQLDEAAKVMKLEPKIHKFLREPMRVFKVNIPVKMDSGKTQVFEGFRVQYNDARGPCKGGIRYHPQETIDTVKALAAWMTWKCAAAGLPYGGGKGGIICDPKQLSVAELERLSRAYVRALWKFLGDDKDIAAPDVGTSAREMGWMLDEYEKIVSAHKPGFVTGKPRSLGGSEGREEATGRGVVYCIRETAKQLNLDTNKLTAAVQGIGNVGSWTAKLLRELLGVKVVAISDSAGGIYSEKGLDIDKVIAYKEKTGKVQGFPGTKLVTNVKLLELPVDILVPAALENQITGENASKLKCKILAEAANGPTTPDADKILNKSKIFVIPDFICNAGGVIVSYLEWTQNNSGYYLSAQEVNFKLDEVISKAFNGVLAYHLKNKATMRVAAYALAISRVAEAMKARGWV